MARPDPVEDLGDRSVLAQNMQYNKTVSRLLKPELERRIPEQAGPPAGTRTIKHPRGIFTRADELENLAVSQKVSQGDIAKLGQSMRITERTVSPRPLSRESGERMPVSTNFARDLKFSSDANQTHGMLSGNSLLPTQIMETHDSPALLTWNWRLRAGKEMEMIIKRDKKKLAATQDGQVVRCECSCDREEQPMVLSLPVAVTAMLTIRSASSNAFAAERCNTITVMATLEKRTCLNIIAISVFLKIRMQRFWGT